MVESPSVLSRCNNVAQEKIYRCLRMEQVGQVHAVPTTMVDDVWNMGWKRSIVNGKDERNQWPCRFRESTALSARANRGPRTPKRNRKEASMSANVLPHPVHHAMPNSLPTSLKHTHILALTRPCYVSLSATAFLFGCSLVDARP